MLEWNLNVYLNCILSKSFPEKFAFFSHKYFDLYYVVLNDNINVISILNNTTFWTLGLTSRVRNHYRTHQMNLWLKLIPQLHNAGKDASASHNHLTNHNDWSSYRGFVRSQPVTRYDLYKERTKCICGNNKIYLFLNKNPFW